jgi:hypothetical protein
MKMTAARRLLLERRTGGLSRPTRLYGWSYSLPAGTRCHLGGQLLSTPGSTCAECYARQGHYRFPNVQAAMERRLRACRFSPTWVADMIELIGSKHEKFFRWHDSGDLQSVTHLQKIVKIAAGLPGYNFWLPTLEHRFVAAYRSMTQEFPENLTVRVSTPLIDGLAIETDECTSSVVSTKASCPAHLQGGRCGQCRDCWQPWVKHVSYQRI